MDRTVIELLTAPASRGSSVDGSASILVPIECSAVLKLAAVLISFTIIGHCFPCWGEAQASMSAMVPTEDRDICAHVVHASVELKF